MSGGSSRRYPLELHERATLNAGDQPPAEIPYRKSPDVPRRFNSLTPFGASLAEALRPLCEWGHAHMEQVGVSAQQSAQR